MARGELFCEFQPEVDPVTGHLFGFEALVRWQHPERGVLSPQQFVPLAEEAGLAGALFDQVLARALDAQLRWGTDLGFTPSVSVNLSAIQLQDTSLPATVARALTRRHLPPDLLWLEVTESAVADAGSMSTLFELHELGVHLAIDDFGTGWSSMSRLSEFPWDALKIDRSFVTGLAQDAQAEHVVRAMIVMAHALGIRTVAEGVETVEQLSLLASMDCDIVQGFLLGRPAATDAAIASVLPDGSWGRPELALTAGLVRPVPRTGGIGRVSALAQRLQGFNDLGAVSPDLLVATGPDGIIHAVNPAWETMLGWTRKQLVGHHHEEFVHPDDVERTRAAFGQLVGGAAVEDLEARWRHEDGRWRWISWASTPLPNSDRIFSSGRDVTERMERLIRILPGEALLTEVEQAAGIGVWEWLPGPDIAYLSPTLRDMLGLPDDVPASQAEQLLRIHPDDRDALTGAVDTALRDGTSYSLEYRFLRTDGRERILRERGAPVAGHGRSRFVGTIQDVTEQRDREVELAHARELLDAGGPYGPFDGDGPVAEAPRAGTRSRTGQR